MNILHTIKRIKQRAYIKYKRAINPATRTHHLKQQTTAYLICKRLIEKEGSILLIAPISDKRYIKQDNGNLFIIIGHDSVQIINHIYSYIVQMSGHTLEKTIYAFDNKMDQTVINMEVSAQSNIQRSLKQIKDDLLNSK